MSPEMQVYFANWTLVTQIVGAITGVLSVGVAILFGSLTLRATRVAKDADERANIAANTTAPDGRAVRVNGENVDTGRPSATTAMENDPQRDADAAFVSWSLQPTSIEHWQLVNTGSNVALSVEVAGLTDRDRTRLHVDWRGNDEHSLDASESVLLQFAQRMSLSGPGTIVVAWSEPDDEPEDRRSLRLLIGGR